MFVGAAVVAAGAFAAPVVGYAGGRLALRTDATRDWLRRVQTALTSLALLVVVGAWVGGAGALGRVSWLGGWPLGAVVGTTAALTAGGLVNAVGVAALTPALVRYRDREIDVGPAETFVDVLGVLWLVPVAAGCWALVAAPLFGGPAWAVPVGLAAVVVVASVGGPRLVAAIRGTRPPTEAERARIDEARTRADVDVPVRLFDEDRELFDSLVCGPPGRKQVFVTPHLLAACSTDEVATLLAVVAGRDATRYDEARLVTLVGIVAALVGALAVGVAAAAATLDGRVTAGVTGLAVAVGLALVGGLGGPVLFAVVRRQRRLADDHAGGLVGRETVAAGIERLLDRQGVVPRRRSGVWLRRSHRVPDGNRIDRLRGEADED